MIIIDTISKLKAFVHKQKQAGKSIGLVPTAGYLHMGHASLMEQASKVCDIVMVSVFDRTIGDFSRNDLDNDAAFCNNIGVNVLFTPNLSDMYPRKPLLTFVNVNKMDKYLCGSASENYFLGTCTLITKLFNLTMPDKAFFGKKDIQQLRVIETMVSDLNFPVEIIPCDIVRANDGLALSSRNKELSDEERRESVIVYKLLQHVIALIKNGELNAAILLKRGREFLNQCKIARLDYLEIVDYENLQPLETVQGQIIIACSVLIGKIHLIDNIIYTV